jgi:hypothetical protein
VRRGPFPTDQVGVPLRIDAIENRRGQGRRIVIGAGNALIRESRASATLVRSHVSPPTISAPTAIYLSALTEASRYGQEHVGVQSGLEALNAIRIIMLRNGLRDCQYALDLFLLESTFPIPQICAAVEMDFERIVC